MKNTIEITISTDTLGDYNDADDNERFAQAVCEGVKDEYPEARVNVTLTSRQASCSIQVSDDPGGRIERDVDAIMDRIWAEAAY